jgi:hypothetical protein
MKCSHCQIENLENSKFCKKCGQHLRAELTCQHCKHQNAPDSEFCVQCGKPLDSVRSQATTPAPPSAPQPTSFANGRYRVKRFLGEGGKKKVYLAHDTTLDRDVAFALKRPGRASPARPAPWAGSATTPTSSPSMTSATMKGSHTWCSRRYPAATSETSSRRRRGTASPWIKQLK